jgi:ABC-2 type transport system permease protein
MPIHNLGYREWEGDRESGSTRWTVVAGIGVRRAWQSAWLRRIAFVAWGPPLAYGILIFVFEQVLTNNIQGNGEGLQGLFRLLLPAEMLPAMQATLAGLDGADREQMLAAARPLLWKAVMLQLQRSQTACMVVVVGLLAPSLISQDVRSRAFLLYFSRPLTRIQYICGKCATVLCYLLLTCTLPQLLLYVFGVLLSPDISVVGETWDLPLRTLAASATIIVPTTLLALMLSSLTVETRFASFGWFAIWIFGLAAYAVMRNVSGDASELVLRVSFLYLLFSDLSVAIFDIPTLSPHTDTQFAFVLALSVICLAVIYRKVSAPLRA